ncbi:MAG: hypothetical protein KJ583_06230 [Nanoarchaeota archaeon]|nr:hypothetical protein [Nanoarchaeota archaeon]MBU1269828.1 hypothetical protein [Nanoarchaeota archaeon]MBU1604883.1 hypothetical protein [Nanoarchaeota archaeon]MBU2443160.1 hypothetical protein [Nanoarchaeota archaeon]
MGLLDKLMFWKKNEPDLGDFSSMNMGSTDNFGLDSKNDDFSKNLGLEPSSDSDLDKPFSTSFGSTGLKDRSYEKSAAQRDLSSSTNSFSDSKDLALISSKLDTIKAELDSMSQRLQRIERTLDIDEKEKKRPLW